MMKKLLSISFYIIVLFIIFNENAISDNLTAYDILKPDKIAYKNNILVLNIVTWYQKRISSKNGPSCMFFPTCSEFFKEAVIMYGPLWGTLMTVDRMFYRENHPSMKHYNYLKNYGRYYDPIETHFILRAIPK